jgi:DNA polymerase-3 subunit gamma/tau
VSYQVIARKYRPQRFEDVVGQEHVTTTLANAIRSGRIAHAYLFCGPRGTGKTTLARIFAKALNCTGGPSPEFDGADPRVKEVTEGRSLDVLEIDGASNNGVEQVRELRDTARFAPAASKFKIYIIDEVHMLSPAAFNALLKTLEEPPAHVKFLFATTDPEKVLPTFLSRCQRFDLRRIPAKLIVEHLGRIAAQESVHIDEAALHAIARGADGGMRDAQSTLDQLISFCGTTVVEADVLSMFGLAARAQLLELADAILAADSANALRLLDQLARSGKDLGRLLGDLLTHFRNLLVFKVSRGDNSLLEVSEAELAALGAQVSKIEAEQLTFVLDTLSQADNRQRDAANKRIFLEVTLLKTIQARDSVSVESVIKHLHELRHAALAATGGTPATPPKPAPPQPVSAATESAPAPAANPPPAPKPPAPAPPPAPAVSADTGQAPLAELSGGESAEGIWKALIGAFAAEPLFTAQLAAGQSRGLDGRTLSVEFHEDEYELLNTPRTNALLAAKLSELGVGDVVVKLVPGRGAAAGLAETREPGAAAAPRPAQSPTPGAPAAKSPETNPAKVQPVLLDKEDFANDPAIRAALAVFKATLIEVRAPAGEAAA